MSIDTQLVIYALRRVQSEQQALADKLHDAHDYNAELPAHDAERLGEAIELVQQRDQLLAALEGVVKSRWDCWSHQELTVWKSRMQTARAAIAAAKGGA